MSSFAPSSYIQLSTGVPIHDHVLLVSVLDSWSWQHFLDHSMRAVAQYHEYESNYVVTGQEGVKSVREYWSSLGYPPPWLTMKSLFMLHPESLSPIPLMSRKIVLYMTRKNGFTLNFDRQTINEKQQVEFYNRILRNGGVIII